MKVTVASVLTKLSTALSGMLGSYRAPNGSTVPALRVERTSAGLTRVPGSGVEVEVRRDTDSEATPYYGGDYSLAGHVELRVIGHDNTAIDPVCKKILGLYPLAQVRYVPGDEVLGILNQATIRIPT